jgi:NAD(P)-dependent dehydrogenase (short-subunit alcohol dehydrogenase family)
MGQFQGKVALVTGGNSGLGRATAEAFARDGAKVVIAARREELGREVESAIRAAGGEATFVSCDIHHEDQIRALIERTVSLYGRLDFAYNNAWRRMPKPALLTEIEIGAYDEMSSLLRGTFLCMKYEIPAMIAGGGGVIVNCSSAATTAVMQGMGHYAAVKAGLEVLTRTAAHEYAGKNIRVNGVCPGFFDTPFEPEIQALPNPPTAEAVLPMIPLQRLGRPPELAEAVLFLCSQGASYITGTHLLVDGGFLLT